MPQQFRAPRGVTDILPEDQPYWRWIRDTATSVAERFGYREIQTPIFEYAGVFIRPGAEGTDLVDKEVYRFEDRGGDDLVLRPEGTAAVCRAYLEHGMQNLPQPVRLFYISSFFRYDRPQAGRYRMFHQFGVEVIGDEGPGVDAEVIDLLRSLYDALGLTGYTLQLNSIGDNNCRPAYLEKLRAYYADKLDRMCGDCQKRYYVNPLRLLDCKNEPCQPFKAAAPKIADNLCEPCAEHFAAVKSMLDGLGIEYNINPTLVRGLDYYTRTAFEFEPKEEGSQSVLGGGGRYDWSDRATGRQTDTRHRLRIRHRAPHPQPAPPGPRAARYSDTRCLHRRDRSGSPGPSGRRSQRPTTWRRQHRHRHSRPQPPGADAPRQPAGRPLRRPPRRSRACQRERHPP